FFVLALARPEARGLFPLFWQSKNLEEIRLGALSHKASATLVRQVLPSADDATVERVVATSAGNALYLEELVRAAAEGRSESPDTVVAMVQARLEWLEPGARRVLRAASVFGRAFWRSGLQALLGGAEATSDPGSWLAVLCEAELVTRRAQTK